MYLAFSLDYWFDSIVYQQRNAANKAEMFIRKNQMRRVLLGDCDNMQFRPMWCRCQSPVNASFLSCLSQLVLSLLAVIEKKTKKLLT